MDKGEMLGVDARNIPIDDGPENTEELELYMQLQYKQGIEIAEEQAIENIFLRNKYDQLKKRIDYDLAVLGIGAAKHSFNNTDGIKLDYSSIGSNKFFYDVIYNPRETIFLKIIVECLFSSLENKQ